MVKSGKVVKGEKVDWPLQIQERAQEIEKLRNLVQNDPKAQNLDLKKLDRQPQGNEVFYTKLDDLFYLRYLLSRKPKHSVEHLAQNVLNSLEWRLSKLESPYSQSAKDVEKLLAYAYTGDLPDGSPVSFLSIPDSNVLALGELEKHSKDAILEFAELQKEKLYQICDERSRRTKKLVQAVSIIDVKTISPSLLNKSRTVLASMLGKGRSFKPHPQLQLETVLLNVSGTVMRGLINAFKGKKVKLRSELELHQQYPAKSAVPSCIGGQNDDKWNKRPSNAANFLTDEDIDDAFDNSSSFSSLSTTRVVTGSEEQWKLSWGKQHSWEIPILYEDSRVVVSCLCETKQKVKISATLYQDLGNGQRKMLRRWPAEEVMCQLVIYELNKKRGTLVFTVLNGKKGIKSKAKRRYKKKSAGHFNYHVQVPEELIEPEMRKEYASELTYELPYEGEQDEAQPEPQPTPLLESESRISGKQTKAQAGSSADFEELTNHVWDDESLDDLESPRIEKESVEDSYFGWLAPYIPQFTDYFGSSRQDSLVPEAPLEAW